MTVEKISFLIACSTKHEISVCPSCCVATQRSNVIFTLRGTAPKVSRRPSEAMDCIRWVLSPCACCCPCQGGREYLLRNRRSLSISTHDDDWDADVANEGKNRLAASSAFAINREMKVQMQQSPRNMPRSMHDVSVTDDDDDGSSSAHIQTGGGQSKGPKSWRGYKSSVLSTEEDGFSSGSEHHSNQNSPTGASAQHQTNVFSPTGSDREPYRDIPRINSPPNAVNGRGFSKQDPVALQSVLLPPPGRNNTVTAVSAPPVADDDDEEVEISLM
jgi:hypothetical protein